MIITQILGNIIKCHIFYFISNLQLRYFAYLKTIVSGDFCPFSIQFDWSVVSCIVAMLVDAIIALSGDLHTYFLMRELSGRTSKFMWCACFLSFFISFLFLSLNNQHRYNAWYDTSVDLNLQWAKRCLKQLSSRLANYPSWRLLIIWKIWHYISH